MCQRHPFEPFTRLQTELPLSQRDNTRGILVHSHNASDACVDIHGVAAQYFVRLRTTRAPTHMVQRRESSHPALPRVSPPRAPVCPLERTLKASQNSYSTSNLRVRLRENMVVSASLSPWLSTNASRPKGRHRYLPASPLVFAAGGYCFLRGRTILPGRHK